MARNRVNFLVFLNILSILLLLWVVHDCAGELFTYTLGEVKSKLTEGCFLAVTRYDNSVLLGHLAQLTAVFRNDACVTVGILDLKQSPLSQKLRVKIDGEKWEADDITGSLISSEPLPEIVFFPKIQLDRSCLLTPDHLKHTLEGESLRGPASLDVLVNFVNSKCGTFRMPNGALSTAGLHREYILSNLFSVGDISELTMQNVYSSPHNPFLNSFTKSLNRSGAMCERTSHDENMYSSHQYAEVPTCPTVSLPLSKEEFFSEYLERSRPVILKGAAREWTAFSRWTQEYLREKYGEETVHVKMTPGGDFEGVESASLWEDFGTFEVPQQVFEKLPHPDLVVVRPAGVSMKFGEFLDLITWAARQPSRNVSAYLEYSSIREYMPDLEADLEEFGFVKNTLKLRHLNIWLSDGNTLGRLHFDPFDNFLCQLKGKKQVTLFEPHHNERMYESHIPQATLSYSRKNHTFRRQHLEDSTSMVMSPVDLLNPNFERFPKFADAQPLNCTIDEGDVLFMPAFWWHEVYSSPNINEMRNLAVNFWYEPFLSKGFPCPECKLDVNPFYHHLLY